MWKLLVFFACMITDVVTRSVIGYRYKRLDIRCPYESGYEGNIKYLCKGECNLVNKNIIIESGSPTKDERFSLTDDRTARVFTVSITDLRTEDGGMYWCAVRRSLSDVFSEIMLLVKQDNMTTEVPTITPFSKNTPSYFSISSLNPQSSNTTSTDQSPPSTRRVIYICVALVIIVIGFLIVLTVLCKQKKQGKKSPRRTQSGSSDVPTVLLPLDTRQDITDESPDIYNDVDSEYQTIGEPSHKNMHSTITLYSTAEVPDSLIYSTAEAQADPMIYSTAEAQADPMIYSTAEAQADPMIYSTAEAQADPMIYTVAEKPEAMIYSTTEKSF